MLVSMYFYLSDNTATPADAHFKDRAVVSWVHVEFIVDCHMCEPDIDTGENRTFVERSSWPHILKLVVKGYYEEQKHIL